VTFPTDLPADAPSDEPDPATFDLAPAQLGEDVASVVGVRFVAAGRIQWCDAGEGDYALGERVMVEGERGPRVATIATQVNRRSDRGLRRVIRRAHDQEALATERADRELRVAKDAAAELGLPLKVLRVEKASGKLLIYYTCDERLDIRDFVRDVAQQTAARIELRQLGARDEAKAVGGIGSCGLTLCCSTWLPEFVPVSIKMAKDQGLVLAPTKVSGQCGRLKCCLVYEQAAYAELRKGLPKLGKRVISARGEGRVVEVDVLRQRVRVSYAPGDTEVLPASEVRPMFPSGDRPAPRADPEHDESEPEPEPEMS
jgi:cell fate regulator YaaT (PSP1 superfamily)